MLIFYLVYYLLNIILIIVIKLFVYKIKLINFFLVFYSILKQKKYISKIIKNLSLDNFYGCNSNFIN